MTPDAITLQIERCLDPIINRDSCCALIGFPNHANVGDSAIWLGELDYLSSRGVNVNYVCDFKNYNRHILNRCHPDGLILIHGGGNLGDLWKNQQQLRETVLNDFPHRTVIQLPQSIHFTKHENAVRAASIIRAHRDFILLVRDHSSFVFAKRYFKCPTHLCPDMAFFISPARRQKLPVEADNHTILLIRTDKEAATPAVQFQITDFQPLDWPKDIWTRGSALYKLTNRIESIPCAVLWRLAQQIRCKEASKMAAMRLARGLVFLAGAERIVTDRLHGVILALLIGRKVFAFDNTYGKVSSYISTWMKGTPNLRLCITVEEIMERRRD